MDLCHRRRALAHRATRRPVRHQARRAVGDSQCAGGGDADRRSVLTCGRRARSSPTRVAPGRPGALLDSPSRVRELERHLGRSQQRRAIVEAEAHGYDSSSAAMRPLSRKARMNVPSSSFAPELGRDAAADVDAPDGQDGEGQVARDRAIDRTRTARRSRRRPDPLRPGPPRRRPHSGSPLAMRSRSQAGSGTPRALRR